MYSSGEPDESSSVPVLDRRSFVDDICFGSETFEACLATLDHLLSRFQECRISVSFTKSLFVQRKVGFLSHEVSAAGITPDAKKAAAVTELSFPASKKGVQSFLGALNYYSRFIQYFAVYGAALYQLKDAKFEPGVTSPLPSRASQCCNSVSKTPRYCVTSTGARTFTSRCSQMSGHSAPPLCKNTRVNYTPFVSVVAY
ncbi:hypothetical protein PF010_g2165 [Phytophthora fragariae]|uniref:Reverse transcriptase domain-containing protein n=1 Tax=Phytophthora fragariae TaxID=53985 RepID=A0A6A3FNP1_9STRA|nr:hypothetical protein PF003_g20027 [Phytophthora fragariae]KAE8947664.1 hypothetical protein PF009_g2727 [Phytophthora fragariae]KAE9135159.1 hypothetical protein PF010_g2165 [Phytophthora fragariae]KAE9135385.1 hypothetical protein PF007_g2557 [Phytophthora fragariae]KAE9252306.1 hypothetical protein PF004_g2035 [Phytophthora fragariae]